MLRILRPSYSLRMFYTISQKFLRMSSYIWDQRELERVEDVQERLIWMDLEMTGLDVHNDQILEIGCLITDKYLKPVDDGVNFVISQPDEVLDQMNEWCKEHHGKSGLTEACRSSNILLSMAEQQVIEYVSKHTLRGKCPLAGNSVHEDKKFIAKYMPRLMDHFHYRIVDVSCVKELCRRWYSEQFQNAPKKQFSHRSLDDIHESIAELNYYRKVIFK